jgi:hypothetical protein
VCTRLLSTDRPRLGEIAVYALVLGVTAVVILGEHVKRSGFYSDDWAYRAVWVQTDDKGFWGQIDNFLHSSSLLGRPTLAVYLSFVQQVFGPHQGAYLAWAVVVAVIFSCCLYLVLRTLGLRPLDAGSIGFLVLVFPASDSTRIWAMISDASVAMSLALLGVFCALRALQTTGRRAVVLRLLATVLMLLGVTTYELTFAALLCSFVLYRTQVGWRRTLQWAVIDWVSLGLVYLLVLRKSTAEHLPLSDAFDHGREVAKELFHVVATTAMPFDTVGAGITVTIAILALGLTVAAQLPRADPTRRALRRWLWTAAIAAIMIAAAYVIYGPSALFYQPRAPGLLNRTNAFGAVPIIVFVYALGALVGTAVFRSRRGAAAAVATLVALGLGVDYTAGMTHHLKLWDSGWTRAHDTLARFTHRVPPPPNQSLVIFYGQPIQEAQNIPVWAHYWDLNGAIQLTYHDPTLRARPAFPGTRIDCQKKKGVLLNDAYGGVVLPTDDAAYGYMYLYDSNSDVLAVPKNQAECKQLAPQFVPGPMVAPDPGARA